VRARLPSTARRSDRTFSRRSISHFEPLPIASVDGFPRTGLTMAIDGDDVSAYCTEIDQNALRTRR